MPPHAFRAKERLLDARAASDGWFWKNGDHTAGSVGMYLGRLACAECLSLSPGPNQHHSKIQIIRYWMLLEYCNILYCNCICWRDKFSIASRVAVVAFPSGMIRAAFLSMLWDAVILEQPAAPKAPTSLTRLKFGENWKLIKLWDKKEIQWGRLLAEHLPAMISAGNSLELLQPFNLWTSNPLLLPKRQTSSPSGCCSIQCKRSTEWVMPQHTTGIPCHASFANTNDIGDMRQTSFT